MFGHTFFYIVGVLASALALFFGLYVLYAIGCEILEMLEMERRRRYHDLP
jgi:hypothetical protein